MTALTNRSQPAPELPALPERIVPAIDELVAALGIPREYLASHEEIEYAWRDLPRELREIPSELRDQLIARMCVAVSTGLFDGAVNYAWNAGILRLREKVRRFGLPVVAQILQKDFEERHLLELQDSQLLELCLKLSLINEDGFFFLDQCRGVRNNFSAAHPSLGPINDREFITFLNRCVKYALVETEIPQGVNISAFISAIGGGRFSAEQREEWVGRLSATHDAQRQMLIGMAHGIYCDPATSEPSRLNALDLCNALRDRFTSSIKSDLINRHSDYLAKGDQERHAASQHFFGKIGMLSLLNDSEKHTIFSRAIERLRNAHLGLNNFYNEPPFAERLLELSQQEKIPDTAQEQYVTVITNCFVGNGYGVSWGAAAKYEAMIKAFSPREITLMIHMPNNDQHFRTKIDHSPNCRQRFKEALSLIEPASIPSTARTEYDEFMRA